MNETKHSKPIVYRIYTYLKENCVGKENAISGRDLSTIFKIDRRTLRTYKHEILMNPDLTRVVMTCNKGYYIPTVEEGIKDLKRIHAQAMSLLEVWSVAQKKAGREGQGQINLGKDYKAFVEAFGKK